MRGRTRELARHVWRGRSPARSTTSRQSPKDRTFPRRATLADRGRILITSLLEGILGPLCGRGSRQDESAETGGGDASCDRSVCRAPRDRCAVAGGRRGASGDERVGDDLDEHDVDACRKPVYDDGRRDGRGGRHLDAEAGVVVQGNAALRTLTVNGSLSAVGTASQPITFTSTSASNLPSPSPSAESFAVGSRTSGTTWRRRSAEPKEAHEVVVPARMHCWSDEAVAANKCRLTLLSPRVRSGRGRRWPVRVIAHDAGGAGHLQRASTRDDAGSGFPVRSGAAKLPLGN